MKSNSNKRGVVIIEGHVQGLANTRALGKAGIPVFVISEYNCIARYSRYCSKFYICPNYLSAQFIKFLVNLAISEDIQGWTLLPSNDHVVYNISNNIEKLKLYYRIISPEIKIFNSIYNKEKLIKLCQSIDIPVPLSWFPESSAEIKSSKFRFPLLIKGKNGLTFYKNIGKKAYLVNHFNKLESKIDEIIKKISFQNIYFQEQLPIRNNKPVSFTAFSVNGEIKSFWMGQKIREHPLDFGTATYCRSVYCTSLIPMAEKLIKELKFTGVCEIEFLFDPADNVYKLIEVNARTWLWVDMAIKDGINYPLMVYNYLNNIKMNYPQSYQEGKEWLHYITDIPYSLPGIIKGYYSLWEIIKSYIKMPRPAVFTFYDIIPGVAEVVLLPLLIIKRKLFHLFKPIWKF